LGYILGDFFTNSSGHLVGDFEYFGPRYFMSAL
jgi:hypothetical protein